jgi:tetratricopeptide (TPR) repeat protein
MTRASIPFQAWLAACGFLSLLTSCSPSKSEGGRESAAANTSGSADVTTASTTKVPITTTSDEARALYTKGRSLAEQLKLQDGRKLFEQAVAKDPDFAMAHYSLALTSPTAKEFFAHLNQAVALSEKASEGERLTILTLQAGANADPAKSLQLAEELVAKYPQDERAHLTLGNAYAARQDYDKAIEELQRSIAIDSSYSPAYNSLGYAYRPVEKYAESEKAFKKYIELVPNDPNPYDSYAELLMKTGRFDESIAQYKKALSIDSHFGSSRLGIASNLMLQGKHAQAIAEAQKLYDAARDDGDRRGALLSQTVIYVDQGKTDLALRQMEKQYALGAKIGDPAAMSGDAVSIGDILLESGKAKEAAKHYQQALDLVTASSLSQEVKEDAKLAQHYNASRVAIKTNDLKTAKAEATEYLNGATAKQNDARIRQAHQLNGMIALQEKDFDHAISELAQANQQDPYVLYSTALAYRGKGDQAKAKETAQRAANMNTLPTLPYAFVRSSAKKI